MKASEPTSMRRWGNLEWCLNGELLRQKIWQELTEVTIKHFRRSRWLKNYFRPEFYKRILPP